MIILLKKYKMSVCILLFGCTLASNQMYAIEAPSNLRMEDHIEEKGVLNIIWDAVPGAVAYEIYGKRQGQKEFHGIAVNDSCYDKQLYDARECLNIKERRIHDQGLIDNPLFKFSKEADKDILVYSYIDEIGHVLHKFVVPNYYGEHQLYVQAIKNNKSQSAPSNIIKFDVLPKNGSMALLAITLILKNTMTMKNTLEESFYRSEFASNEQVYKETQCGGSGIYSFLKKARSPEVTYNFKNCKPHFNSSHYTTISYDGSLKGVLGSYNGQKIVTVNGNLYIDGIFQAKVAFDNFVMDQDHNFRNGAMRIEYEGKTKSFSCQNSAMRFFPSSFDNLGYSKKDKMVLLKPKDCFS